MMAYSKDAEIKTKEKNTTKGERPKGIRQVEGTTIDDQYSLEVFTQGYYRASLYDHSSGFPVVIGMFKDPELGQDVLKMLEGE